MKRLIKLMVLATLMISATESYSTEASSLSAFSTQSSSYYALNSVISPVASTVASTLDTVGAKIEIEAVQDDARVYLAGGEMSENLEEVILMAEEIAVEKGMDELVGNPERIALEIVKL